jgi:hypothetical protein
LKLKKKKEKEFRSLEVARTIPDQSRPLIPTCDNVRIPEVFELLTATMPNY